METITIDGMDEHDFRHSIENMLRLDQADQAVEKLRLLLEPYAGPGSILPTRFLEVQCGEIEFAGWHRIAARLADHDKPDKLISALVITLADARNLGGPGPANGRLAPFIKTFYFSDDAYPFSIASRDDLLDGYTREGFEWEADFQATDVTLTIKGLDDLYGAIVELEERLFELAQPPADQVRAGSIGACYITALIYQGLRATIQEKGLPRPLCVLIGCDGVYPFFDAPVVGCEDDAAPDPAAALTDDTMPEDAMPEDAMPDEVWPSGLEDAALPDEDFADPAEATGLLAAFTRKLNKTPVLVVSEEDLRESAHYIEMAESRWLMAEDTDVLTRLPEVESEAALVETALIGDAAAWHTYDTLDHRAEPDDAVLTDAQDKHQPLIDTPEMDKAELTAAQDLPAMHADQLEDVIAAELELDEMYSTAPGSHSLRSRIKVIEPDFSVTRMERFRAMLDRLKQLIFRRGRADDI